MCLPACLQFAFLPFTAASLSSARPRLRGRVCRMPAWTGGLGPEADASSRRVSRPLPCSWTRVFTGAGETAEPWFSPAERGDRRPGLQAIPAPCRLRGLERGSSTSRLGRPDL